MFLVGCASAKPQGELPEVSRFVEAAPAPSFVPHGELVDPENVEALGLEQLLVYADAHSPLILVAQSEVGMAEAEVVEAEIYFQENPRLSLGLGRKASGDESGLSFEVGVEQSFEIAGEAALREEAAVDQQLLMESTLAQVRWSVHVEVHRLFVEILLIRERRAQAARFAAFSESVRDVVSREVEAGDASPLLLMVAEADLAQTREALIEADQQERGRRARLAGIIGWPEDELPALVGELPPVAPALGASKLLSLMAEHHPSLRTRELAVVAGHSLLRLEEKEAWPEISLGLAYEREPGLGEEEGADVVALSVGVPLPLWQSNQGGVARAEAALTLADHERSANAVALRMELQEARVALDAALESVQLYESDIVPKLEQSLSLLERAYELGEVDIHQVSQTRERMLEASARFTDARAAYYQAAVTLEALVGTQIWTEVTP